MCPNFLEMSAVFGTIETNEPGAFVLQVKLAE